MLFKRGREYVNQWRDAFRAYLSDPVTGRNFEIAEMGEIEERCYERVVSESGIDSVEGEICLEFLTPFPFKAEKARLEPVSQKTSLSGRLKGDFHGCLEGRSFTGAMMTSFQSSRITGATRK